MAEQQQQAQQKNTNNNIPAFGVENVHENNCDLMLQGIEGGLRLRGPIKKPVVSQHGGQCPAVPGAQLHVNPKTGQYRMYDPLNDDEHAETRTRLQKWLNKASAFRSEGELRGARTIEGKIDRNRMKTLCRELVQLAADKSIKAAKGAIPTMEEVDSMPGRYLLNPGARIPNMQPRYEDEFDDWKDKLTTAAG